MNISHIIWSLLPGGAETMLIDIVNCQVKYENVSIIIINTDVDEDLLSKIDPRCIIYQCRRNAGSKSLLPWFKLNIFTIVFKPDIIHCHLEGFSKMILYPAPKVFTIHNTHTSGKEYIYFKSLFSISKSVQNHTQLQGFPSKIIYNGIQTNQITPKKDQYIYKKGSKCKIVAVGRLYTEHKGQDLLLDALKIIRDRGYNNFHLDIIGDGPSLPILIEKIKNQNLSDVVSMLGYKSRDYIYNNLCYYDLFVLPSRSEGFGLSVAEACIAKVPVIISNLDGPMEVINSEYGYIFECGNSESLAYSIISYLNEGANPVIVNKAYNYVIQNFDIKSTAENYISEYKKII